MKGVVLRKPSVRSVGSPLAIERGQAQERGDIVDAEAKCRGVVFSTNMRYLSRHSEYEQMSEIKERMSSAGHEIDLDNIRVTWWYPLSARLELIEAIRDVLKWQDADFEAMGYFAARNSTVMGYYLRHLVDIQTAIRHAPVYWQKHYSIGRIEVCDMKEDRCDLKLVDFIGVPNLCAYLKGYYTGVGQMSRGVGKGLSVTEEECACRGAPHHCYRVRWEP